MSAGYKPNNEDELQDAYADERAAAQDKLRTASRTVADEVLTERFRQVESEGWAPAHDDEHGDGEIANAAACYALMAGGTFAVDQLWPKGWEPLKAKTQRRSLVVAAAMLLAEIERVDRASLTPCSGNGAKARVMPSSHATALEAWNTRSTLAARNLDNTIEAILTAGHLDQEDLARLRAAYENNAPERRLDEIKQSALSIFNDPPSETPQVVRDVIEWYDATLRQP